MLIIRILLLQYLLEYYLSAISLEFFDDIFLNIIFTIFLGCNFLQYLLKYYLYNRFYKTGCNAASAVYYN